ncbi:hypothetical protein FISHEDRAFT_70484 [Fistulina hepatica ATCC 64428]|uniref:Uncharacterized protein n=1 Tax=Fistulina hepatica ATCC 64428 TaxID=1128425 RepID=A0A0D7AKD1_9AGAR|nr:hypothetical protein FISHEDRAFT_70484 [Fistulina hepatica ATCC 64428]
MGNLVKWAIATKRVEPGDPYCKRGEAYEALLFHTGLTRKSVPVGLTLIFSRDGKKTMDCIYLQSEDGGERMKMLPPWESYALRCFLGYDDELPQWYEDDPFERGLLPPPQPTTWPWGLFQPPKEDHRIKATKAIKRRTQQQLPNVSGQKRAISEAECAREDVIVSKKKPRRRKVVPVTDRKTRSTSRREEGAQSKRAYTPLVTLPTSDSSRESRRVTFDV